MLVDGSGRVRQTIHQIACKTRDRQTMRRLDATDPSVRITMRIPSRRREAIAEVVSELGITENEFVRRAVEDALARHRRSHRREAVAKAS
jgi:predicted DNA binding CopG/RHH family protein